MADNEIELTSELVEIDDNCDYVPRQWTKEELQQVAEGYREVWENMDIPEEECPF